jgi:hypothetical protein
MGLNDARVSLLKHGQAPLTKKKIDVKATKAQAIIKAAAWGTHDVAYQS